MIISRYSVIAFMLLGGASLSAGDFPAESKSDPAPNTGEVDRIMWWSDADVSDPKRDFFQVTRIIYNAGEQARRVTWPLGRMMIPSIRPGEWARHSPPPVKGRNEVKGPIYTRLNAASSATTVFQGVEESEATEITTASSLSLRTEFTRGAKGKKEPFSGLALDAKLSPGEGGNYTISLIFTNMGKDAINLNIGGLPATPDVLGQVKEAARIEGNRSKTVTIKGRGEVPLAGWIPITLVNGDHIIEARIEMYAFIPLSPW